MHLWTITSIRIHGGASSFKNWINIKIFLGEINCLCFFKITTKCSGHVYIFWQIPNTFSKQESYIEYSNCQIFYTLSTLACENIEYFNCKIFYLYPPSHVRISDLQFLRQSDDLHKLSYALPWSPAKDIFVRCYQMTLWLQLMP